MNREKIQNRARNRLNTFLNHLESFKLKLEDEILINSTNFRTKEDVDRIVNEINNEPIPKIYKFTIDLDSERELVIAQYRKFKIINKANDSKDRLCISRFNNQNKSSLYIGSKMKNIKTRIKQHLGEGYDKTYAMQLNQWDSNIDYKLKIEIYSIETKIEEQFKRNFIELIEQELWEEYKPIFGKKSGL